MRRPSLAVPLAALLTALAGCGRCGATRPAAPPAARFVPAAATAALVIPHLGEASRQAAALYAALQARPGSGDLATLRTALGAQLGLDLLDPASLAAAGLDPERGLAVALLPPAAGTGGAGGPPGAAAPQPVLVLPAGHGGRLQALVDRLARDRLGAGEPANEGELVVWRRGPGAEVVLSAAFTQGAALLAPGTGGAAALRRLLALEASSALDQAPAWRQAQAALGEPAAALAWLPPGSPALEGLLGLPHLRAPGGLLAGLSASTTGARLVVAALLGAEELHLRPLARPGPGRGDPPAIPAGAAVAIRLSADPAAAAALPDDRLPPALAPLRGLAAALRPPVDLAIDLPPEAALGRLLTGREGDPLRLLRVEVVAPIAPGHPVDAALAALAGPAARRGPDGDWQAALGEDAAAAWRTDGDRLHLVAGPAAAVRPLGAAPPSGFTAPSPHSAQALSGGLGGAVVHLDHLVRAVRALPPSAFGAGPDGVVARSMAQKAAALPGRGAAASLRVDLPEGALRLALELELGEPAGAAP